MSVAVVLDDREPAGLVAAVRANPDVESVQVRRLAAGDLVVRGVGFERKTPADYVGSAIGRTGFDVERPQLLTYGDTGAGCDGELVLGSTEYGIPVGQRDFDEENPPNVFDDEDADATAEWHVDHGAEHALTLPVNPQAGLPENFPESPADVALKNQLRTSTVGRMVRLPP